MARYHHSTDVVSREQDTREHPESFGRPPEWTLEALCDGHPEWSPDAWFDRGCEAVARRVCNGDYTVQAKPCPVRSQCVLFAVENEIRDGVWGGLEPKALGKLVDVQVAARKQQEALDKLERESKCSRGHQLTMDNLTPTGKCLTCAKDNAVFRRNKSDLVKRGELTA